MRIDPRNLSAQQNHLAVGNPASTLPHQAISNCFPGLEFDFRNTWRRLLEGVVFSENSAWVESVEEPTLEYLVGHRLLEILGRPVVVPVQGPQMPGGDSNDLGYAEMEWSNILAYAMLHQGELVPCRFTRNKEDLPVALPKHPDKQCINLELRVRPFFARGADDQVLPVIAEPLLQPGELTWGLCSPWQNDYRECACYYWAASRPDYVNVEPTSDGLSRGDMWMAKKRTGEYIPDDREDSRLLSYDDMFSSWQALLRFQVEGKDAEATPRRRRE